jgi:hypothetical protein
MNAYNKTSIYNAIIKKLTYTYINQLIFIKLILMQS